MKEGRPNILIVEHDKAVPNALERSLATMLQSVNDAVIATDDEGRVSFLNTAAEALTGWNSRDALGLPIEMIYTVSTLAGAEVEQCQLRKALLLRTAISRERFLFRSRAGVSLPIENSADPILEGGHLLGAVTILRDITDVLLREKTLATEREQLEQEMQITTEALGQTRSDLRSFSEHLISAQDEERRRLANTVHDDFSQRTALLGFQVDDLSEILGWGHKEVQERLDSMRTQIAALSHGLAYMSHDLNPSVLNDLGLLPALRSLVQDFQSIGIDVSLSAKGTAFSQITPELAAALYKIAQEAIRNAVKHAENAAIRIALSLKDEHLQLTIEHGRLYSDVGAENSGGGLGMLGIQERARMAGGTLLVRKTEGKVTQLVLRVPYLDSTQAI